MREILNIQIGQCGNQVGTQFWETLLSEHRIERDGMRLDCENLRKHEDRTEVMFTQLDNNRYAPRAVLIDSEPSCLDSVRSGALRNTFKASSFVSDLGGAQNNWAKGFYSVGTQLLDPVLDTIRREIEECDSLQGVQFTHSIGGGTGSGFGSQLISKIREDVVDGILSTYTVFPSEKVSQVVVEPYNSVLASSYLVDNADAVMVMDNEALGNLASTVLKVKTPRLQDFNHLIANTMNGTTCSLRYPGQLNSDLRKLCVNLTPFPRLHFFVSSNAPLGDCATSNNRSATVSSITSDLFNPKHLMCRESQKQGKLLTASVMFRGKVSSSDIDENIRRLQSSTDLFTPWIPNNVKVSLCNVPQAGSNAISGSFIGNSTSVQTLVDEMVDHVDKMMRRKAFLHWYTAEGMDEKELTEASENLRDLAQEYAQQDGELVEEDEESDYEDYPQNE